MTMATTTAPVIPADLLERDQWVLYREEERGGKSTKVPYQLDGKPASSTDPSTWGGYEDVVRVRSTSELKPRTAYAGIGFVFSADDPFTGIDLDNCLEDTDELEIKPWAQPIVQTFSDSYIEISPGGFGLHIFCKATLPGAGKALIEKRGHQ